MLLSKQQSYYSLPRQETLEWHFDVGLINGATTSVFTWHFDVGLKEGSPWSMSLYLVELCGLVALGSNLR